MRCSSCGSYRMTLSGSTKRCMDCGRVFLNPAAFNFPKNDKEWRARHGEPSPPEREEDVYDRLAARVGCDRPTAKEIVVGVLYGPKMFEALRRNHERDT